MPCQKIESRVIFDSLLRTNLPEMARPGSKNLANPITTSGIPMAISAFELFTIGIGPSSSHTIGPMRAARRFVQSLDEEGRLDKVYQVQAKLYGSLGATGLGHGSDKAVLAGLSGIEPETADPDQIAILLCQIRDQNRIRLAGKREIEFHEKRSLKFTSRALPYHSNGMEFSAFDEKGECLKSSIFYSVGGGFVVDEEAAGADRIVEDQTSLPYSFKTGQQLLQLCQEHGLSISTLMKENELAWRSEEVICDKLLQIWKVMRECVERGCRCEGILPGGLKVRRRAAPMHRRLIAEAETESGLNSRLDWVNLWALAVNEENAAGGRVVTAPTNGAAGIIPAVLHYLHRFCLSDPSQAVHDDATIRFLLTSAAIGILFKENASISGAEVGCQGEVGSACSMAAAGLTEVLGGTPQQVENAAEIAMEHNLGLTCDPIGGLVQVPCIERNAMASVKAINASRLALRGDGTHYVSLDKVIKTMRETGKDMKTKYKETARGGLAVNVIEC